MVRQDVACCERMLSYYFYTYLDCSCQLVRKSINVVVVNGSWWGSSSARVRGTDSRLSHSVWRNTFPPCFILSFNVSFSMNGFGGQWITWPLIGDMQLRVEMECDAVFTISCRPCGVSHCTAGVHRPLLWITSNENRFKILTYKIKTIFNNYAITNSYNVLSTQRWRSSISSK